MVNPQKENGFTPISNELLEAIYSSPFNATQLKIVMVVCRYTYGFSRKEHYLSESFIAKAIGTTRQHTLRELNKLIGKNVIIVIKSYTGTTPRILALNKYYDKWGLKIEVYNPTRVQSNTGVQSNTSRGVQSNTQDNQNLKQNLKQGILKESISNLTPIQQTIEDFKDMRKAIKKPITPGGLAILLKNLEGMANTDEKKIEILEQSILNNWNGVYELKGGTKNNWGDF